MNGKLKSRGMSMAGILFSMVFAIAVHASLPAGVDESQFDSIWVGAFGFPVVACLYYLVLFAHCALLTGIFGYRSSLSRMQVALRYGVSFALIYIVGMQEVVVEASPFAEWGWAFIRYEFMMGLGDAIPVVLLCLIISYIYIKRDRKNEYTDEVSIFKKCFAAALFAIVFFIVRMIGYKTGLYESDIVNYPIQTYAWTILFGMAIGVAYVILYPIYAKKTNWVMNALKETILTIGLNWMIFNSFIGLIFKGVMPQMLLRAGIDTMSWFIAAIIVGKVFLSGASVKEG
ncbi:MAG: hypothetical protein FWF69_08375 [Firmicutes bacterium]|nr:hypothetical protein [Bacillota bacterium]